MRTEWRWQGLAALLWTICMMVVAVHQWQFWQAGRLDVDVLAMLPSRSEDPLLRAADARLAGLGERDVVVLVGADSKSDARHAAEMARQVLLAAPGVLRENEDLAPGMTTWVRALAPWRDRLLTENQRHALNQADPERLARQAMIELYQPLATPRLAPIAADPLNLWAGWWAERTTWSKAHREDGRLLLQSAGRHFVILNLEALVSAFSVTGATPISDRIDAARQTIRSVDASAELLAAGVPLHAEAAAAQASFEINTIGWGSLLAVFVLVWLTFRSIRPIVLIGLSLFAGCATALSVTAWWFGKVHLLTLVFGASLVGVAEDYGFHWFAARQSEPRQKPADLQRHLLPGLALALATSVVAYLALGLAPFPGLRQMAVFSATGLIAAFLTVLCWFPGMDRQAPQATRFSTLASASLERWPRWQGRISHSMLALLLGGFAVVGMMRLSVRDDVRQLHAAPDQLVAMQSRIGLLLGLPSPAQFYLVSGMDADQVMQREEALQARLDSLIEAGKIVDIQALSTWLPSAARQEENARLTAQVETAVLQHLNVLVDEALQRDEFSPTPLTLDVLQGLPQSERLLRQWLGVIDGQSASMVGLGGVDPADLAELGSIVQGLPGVRFVDRSAAVSEVLGTYRTGMSGLLVLGYFGVFGVLVLRYRRNAWRAITPTLIGSVLTLALFGWLGMPIQLFVVLALLLLLGMGVDYGIFLLEHPGDGSAWLAVALAGISTLLAFGLLALSATPAMRAFGLTMLIGEVAIWLTTPLLRLPKMEHS